MAGGALGVMIGEKHTLRDWNLGWTAITLGFSEPKLMNRIFQGQTEHWISRSDYWRRCEV